MLDYSGHFGSVPNAVFSTLDKSLRNRLISLITEKQLARKDEFVLIKQFALFSHILLVSILALLM